MAIRSFAFSAGSPALNFVDTMARRRDTPHDLLPDPPDLTRWLKACDFGAPMVGGDIKVPQEQCAAARDLREAIHRVLDAALQDTAPDEADVLHINTWAAAPGLRPQFIDGAVHVTAAEPIYAALATIAADAVHLMDADTLPTLRRCPECGMLFKDKSRPQKRVWCSSASGCGNRAKVRRHRARQRKPEAKT